VQLINFFKDILSLENLASRILLITLLVVGAHFAVSLVRRLSHSISSVTASGSFAKLRSIASLTTSLTIFLLYFGAFGVILNQLGVSLKAYLASASVIGLAVGFGSQGLVQDVVTGLTLIFSDLFDIGDMVEISGQTGIIRSIGMRFTVLENALGAEVFIPNRTITNVVNYPRGYIRCIVDVTLSGDADSQKKMESVVQEVMNSTFEQFPGILVASPSIEAIEKNVEPPRPNPYSG
jgi:small conductance mechanosensitive channel